MLPLRLEPQDLHLEFYIRKWICIDWRMFGFSGLRLSQVPLGSFAAPNGPGVIVYLPSEHLHCCAPGGRFDAMRSEGFLFSLTDIPP